MAVVVFFFTDRQLLLGSCLKSRLTVKNNTFISWQLPFPFYVNLSMGTGSSRLKQGQHAPASQRKAGSTPPPGERVAFVVHTQAAPGDPSVKVSLQLSSEAMQVFDEGSGILVHQVFYYRIVCWGYSPTTFHWKAYSEEDESQMQSFSVTTEEGQEIERHVMSSVRVLMGKMDAKGLTQESFRAMLATLKSLGEDGMTDHALGAVKQMAMGRKFDARQAAELINALGVISPFDKVEGCCSLYPDALLHKSSFPTLLIDCFEDPVDRENVTHRLGLVLRADGSIQEEETVASKLLAAAGKR